jgi:asparagine synthase (glutamine-hydrolysing)
MLERYGLCGIAGVIGPLPSRVSSLALLAERQRERGPDDSGLSEIDSIAALGHTRLSILDLSDAGHQPMQDPTGRFILTFNGEVHNYRELRKQAEGRGWAFKGASDTEVLLACWALFGERILKSLNGMFAFCMADRIEQSAVLVRDRFDSGSSRSTTSTLRAVLRLRPCQTPWPLCSDQSSFTKVT